MQSANILQVNLLIKNFLRVIEQENGPTLEISIQSEVALLMDNDRKTHYK